jgi:predicted SAM-dependent methyltransferase
MTKLNVGCGPHHSRRGWHNIDLRPFPGVDEVRDATKPFDDLRPLTHVYAEHFLEHLPLDGALAFLTNTAASLVSGGRLRLSTPSLEWVIATHFDPASGPEAHVVNQTYAVNRAFHGWGHQFLWSKPLLTRALQDAGFAEITWFGYGESHDPDLQGLEQHGGYATEKGFPNVWIVEGLKGEASPVARVLLAEAEAQYLRYVRSGH